MKRAIRRTLSSLKRTFLSGIHATIGNIFRIQLSSKAHGDQYENYLKLILEGGQIDTDTFQYKILNSRSFQESWLDSPSVPLIKTINSAINENPNLKICIDLGSGTGWVSNILSEKFDRVLAIEPSSYAIEISKHYFGRGSSLNIEWKHGLAEQVLFEQNGLNGPIFVFTGVVLSHTPNIVASKILRFINDNLDVGSSGLLVEAWGNTRSESLWHVRPKAWWQENLSNCELDFYGPKRENMPGEYLGLKFKKIK